MAITSQCVLPRLRRGFVFWYQVLKNLAAYLIPRMYGFDMLYEGAGGVPSNVMPAKE
jgi:hypothetical protein